MSKFSLVKSEPSEFSMDDLKKFKNKEASQDCDAFPKNNIFFI